MTTQNKIAVPRLPLWRLEMMREQAVRKAARARESYDDATAELHELLRVIAARRAEERRNLLATVEGVTVLTDVEMPDLRGFAVPASEQVAP